MVLLILRGERKRPTHKATETIKSSRNSGLGVDFNEDVLLCVDIDLEKPSTIQRTVHKHQEALERR